MGDVMMRLVFLISTFAWFDLVFVLDVFSETECSKSKRPLHHVCPSCDESLTISLKS